MTTMIKEAMEEALGVLPPSALELLIRSKSIQKEELLAQVDSCLDAIGKDRAMVLSGEKSVVDHHWRNRVETKVRHLRRDVQRLEREIVEHKQSLTSSMATNIEGKVDDRINHLEKVVDDYGNVLFPLLDLVINKFPNCQTVREAREYIDDLKKQIQVEHNV